MNPQHTSHPFGDLLSQHLHRRHGLSQAKLAAGILQALTIITAMCKGARMTGPQARERVVAIIGWLHQQGALDRVDEANALLAAAGMSPLAERHSGEAALIQALRPAEAQSKSSTSASSTERELGIAWFKTFGDLLRHLRLRAGLTQRELGQAVGYGEAQINRLESGVRLPDVSLVAAQFIPALHLQNEPQTAARLIELAALTRGEPAPTSLTLTHSIQRKLVEEIEVASRKRRSNLPAQVTSFVGREVEIIELSERVKTTRLLTLTGSGGCGKTRLALEVATCLVEAGFPRPFEDGAWLVEFASITDASLVPLSVAGIFNLPDVPNTPIIETLVNNLVSKHLLLVLDNCEHLIEACAQLVERLLRDCSNVHVLATSRESLRISGEVNWRVPSLPQDESIHLFVERARAIRPDFVLADHNAQAVARICRQLDGIPLAIELAAARSSLLPVEQIADRLHDRFRLLTGGSRTALPRHQTLRALIDWSYDLLTAAEQATSRRLSVFAGGWTLEAAEAIGGSGDVLDVLSNLVNKSLVIVEHKAGMEVRYRMLETIRQYAHDRLQERGEVEPIRDQHLNYFLQLAERAEPHLRAADQIAWLDRLEAELDNFRAALEWSLEGERHIEAGLQLASALMWFWHLRDHRQEGSAWLERALSAEARTRDAATASQLHLLARVQALNAVGLLMITAGNHARLSAVSEESLSLSRELGELGKHGTAFALWNLAIGEQNLARARTLCEESLTLYRELNDSFGMAECHLQLGVLALLAGDYEHARMHQEQNCSIRRELGDKDGMATACRYLGRIAFRQGDLDRAAAMYVESLILFTDVNSKWGAVSALTHLASVALARGEHEQAVKQSQQALALARETGHKDSIAYAQFYLATIAWSRGNYKVASQYYVESLILFRDLGDEIEIAAGLCGLGNAALAECDPDKAAQCYEEALALGRKMESDITVANALFELGRVAYVRDDFTSARSLHGEALDIRRSAHDRWGVAFSLDALAALAVAQGQAQQAARLFGAGERLHELIQWTLSPFERDMHERAIDAARAQLDESTFAAVWAEGQKMTLDEAVELALAEVQ